MPTTSCVHCSAEYPLTPANAMVYSFWHQAWFAFLASVCPHCNTESRKFLGPNYQSYLELFTELGLPFIMEDFADDELVEQYGEVYELKPLKEYRLTQRLEQEVETLHKVLDSIPDELLWDCLSEPAPNGEKPERWID